MAKMGFSIGGVFKGITKVFKKIGDTVGGIVNKVFKGIKRAVGGVADGIGKFLSGFYNGLRQFMDDVGWKILGAIGSIIAIIKGGAILGSIGVIKAKLATLLNAFTAKIAIFKGTILEPIMQYLKGLTATVANLASRVKSALDVINTYLNKIKPVVELVEAIIDKKVLKALYYVVHLTDNQIARAIDNVIFMGKDVISAVIQVIRAVRNDLLDKIADVYSGISTMLTKSEKYLKKLMLNQIAKSVHNVKKYVDKIYTDIRNAIDKTYKYITGLINYVRKPIYEAYMLAWQWAHMTGQMELLQGSYGVIQLQKSFPKMNLPINVLQLPKWIKEWWE